MRRFRWLYALMFVACGLDLLTAKMACAVVIYQTGFESPIFTAGLADGQDDWLSPLGSESVRITTSQPRAGQQGLQIFGADLDVEQFDQGIGFTRRIVDYDATGTPIVTIRVDARLDGPQTTSRDIVSINLEANTQEFDYLGGLVLSSSGNAYVFGSIFEDAYLFETPIALGQWYSLGLRVDFASRTTEFLLDEQSLGVLPFDPLITSKVLRTGFLAMVLEDKTFDAAPYIGSFDNYVITAVPEPASLAMVGMGLLCYTVSTRSFASRRARYGRSTNSKPPSAGAIP